MKSEKQTRIELIDQLLAQSSWNVQDPTQVVEEFGILTAQSVRVAEPPAAYQVHQFSDYVLLGKDGKCPFCGITDMLGIYHSKREAYDHYLPKGIYPFNSINFRNLVPACHYCNSSYKSSKDLAFTPKDPAGQIRRRKAFYPYSTSKHKIEISINFKKLDIDCPISSDVQLTFGPNALSEEIDTWKEVYSIEERYKAKCCSNDAKDWLKQVRILHDKCGIKPKNALAIVQEQAEKDPIANSNFLKTAFLEGCHRIGLWT